MLRRKLYLRNNIIFLLIVGIIPIVISEAIMSNLGYSGSWNAAFLITPVAPVVLMTLSFLKLTQRDQDLIIQLLHTSNLLNENSKMMNPGVGERQLASFIHNSIQSEFLALAGQMQDAAKTGDKNHLLNLRNQVEEVVNRSFIHDFERFAKSPYERLRNVQESWNGLLNLNVDIPKEIFEIPDKAGIIVQTIEEFTANSYRHGKASHVTVTGRLGNSGVQLHLHSNGVESLVKKRGFGSEWLDQIAISDWNINVDASGTSLTIEI
jgi:hypothetical protein